VFNLDDIIRKMVEEANRKYGTVCITAIVDVASGRIKGYDIGVGACPLIHVRRGEDLIWIYKSPTETLTEERIKEEIRRQLEDIRSSEPRYYAPYPRYMYKRKI